MLFKKFNSLKQNILENGRYYFDLGRDIYLASMEVYNSRKLDRPKINMKMEGDESRDVLRKNLEKNFSNPDPMDPSELARQTSLKSHKVLDHDPGERWNSNMQQRNYVNHQGN